ncbi:shikimate dehydrogenase [Nocardiopsis sp. RSe5-2]|uniref:Shikimate dehydrogenase n=1 Tax=Nocardiopsis endophytica TaxID=3018445 RepID=A0ABT4UAY5_9ACTN|nr:shikimate dehydrogenase [Nocardiopsis endophytica]MDA2814057.1 shikimate dehydrogenase [Nocardiopsis endophytica]
MRAAVLGSPVEHSLSPVLHGAAYEALGIAGEWSYGRHECREDGLLPFLRGCGPEWAGLSLTMPLKKAALDAADAADDASREVGASNTLVFREGRRLAYNTDVYGIGEALREAGAGAPRTAAVLGGGATAASAVAALRRLGAASVTVLARDPARAEGVRLAGERAGIAVELAPLAELERHIDVDLVASTLPSGAADPWADTVAASGAAVFDVVYSPWPTVLGRAAAEAGRTVVGGFPMLLHQAAAQVELMTGAERAPVERMRRAGEAELARRAEKAAAERA